MSRWTQDGAHVAALCALVAGLGFAAFATSGPTMAAALLVVALSLAAIVALRALETRDGHKQAVDALAKVTALEARLEAAEKVAEEAKKTALAASTAASSRPRNIAPTY